MLGQQSVGDADSPRRTAAFSQAGTCESVVAILPEQDRLANLGQGLARERPHAVQGLVERHAEAELVRARVRLLAFVLLGGHVGRSAEDRAREGEAGVQRSPQRSELPAARSPSDGATSPR